ncbi:MAG: helix-turn-helix domain-containing protein, partial [Chitinophagales bacterium]|nr:helix-turn-helix domain-containing protein [Chitinophagales bacterium]
AQITKQLFNLLKDVRKNFADEENIAPYMICHDSTLNELALFLPQDIAEMSLIKGMGDRTLNKYGETFLETIQAFSNEHELSSRIMLKEEEIKKLKQSKKSKPKEAVDTKTQSFNLFQSGKSVSEIAVERSMSPSTIESHLSHFVKLGKLDVNKFVTKEKFDLIKEAIQKTAEPGLGPIKFKLGDQVSYSEIRFVIAATQRDKNSS